MSNIEVNVENIKTLEYLPIVQNIEYVEAKDIDEILLTLAKINNSVFYIGNININNSLLKSSTILNKIEINQDKSDKIVNTLKINTLPEEDLLRKKLNSNIKVGDKKFSSIFTQKGISEILEKDKKTITNRRQKIHNIGVGMLTGKIDFPNIIYKYFRFNEDSGKNWGKLGLKLLDKTTDIMIAQISKGINEFKDELIDMLINGSPLSKLPSKDDITNNNKSKDTQSNNGKLPRTERTFLGELMASADFQSNYYNATLLFNDGKPTTEKRKVVGLEPLRVSNQSFLATRLKGVDIPQNTRETFETKFLNTSIKRITPKVNVTRTATLTFDEDDNFFVSSNFEHLSGVHSWKTLSSTNNILAPVFNSRYTQLRVIHRIVGSTLYKKTEGNLPKQPTVSPQIIIYTFNDVAFLGKTNSYEFKRGDASQNTVSVKFTFRQVSISRGTDNSFNPFTHLKKVFEKSVK